MKNNTFDVFYLQARVQCGHKYLDKSKLELRKKWQIIFVFWIVKFDVSHFVKCIYDYAVIIILKSHNLTILKTKRAYI